MTKKVLVIEDDNILQRAMDIALSDAGFEVSQAFDGETGLSKAKTEKPDVILLDLMLPKIPGEQVLKEMNESGLIEKIPVVVFSVKGDEASIKNCLDIWGAKDFLTKSSYTVEEVVDKIRKVIK